MVWSHDASSLGPWGDAADDVERAIEAVLAESSLRTPDMGGKAKTIEVGTAIAEAVGQVT